MEWRDTMQPLGKASPAFFERVILPRLGAKRPEVLVGPKFGVDNAVVSLGDGKVLVSTTDPLSFIPELGPQTSAWLSVHLLASDLTTSGLSPDYGIFDFNLPPRMGLKQFADYWKAFDRECRGLGISIVGGHTGRYEGCGYTVIGGGIMCAIGPESEYLTSAMAQVGDDVTITKGVAIETTAILTRVFPRTIKRVLGKELFAKAWGYLKKVTTVQEALAAASTGLRRNGVTAMHDATEGGLIAGVIELATASRLGVEVDLESVPISEETAGICRRFRIDPLSSLSEGTLILASKPNSTSRVVRKLRGEGIVSETIGRLTKHRGKFTGIKRGRQNRIRYPKFDPYWKAYWSGIRKGWK